MSASAPVGGISATPGSNASRDLLTNTASRPRSRTRLSGVEATAASDRNPAIPGRVPPPGREEVYMLNRSLGVVAQVNANPTQSGLPGSHLLQQMINWLDQIALWGSLASILLGAAIYGLAQQSGNYAGGSRGKQLALAGVVGACLAGVAPTAINMFFKAAGG